MHGLQWCVEDVDALEEEGPLLFEEDRKPLVRRDDGLVGLDLREVRIHGEIKRDRWRKAVLCGHTDVEFQRLVQHSSRIEQRRVNSELRRCQSIDALSGFGNSHAGNDFERSLSRYTFQAGEMSFLRQHAGNVPTDRYP